jgi:hypothetical protein
MRRLSILFHAIAAVCASSFLCSGSASAYESENSIPLSIVAANWKVGIEDIAIRLDGRDVAISTILYNDTKSSQRSTFYASTPLFHQLGEGEVHLDKTFSDLRVVVDGKPRKTDKHVRSYFLGRDITESLVKAGIDPKPSLDTPYSKLERLPKVGGQTPVDWDASITYGWTDSIAPGKRSKHEIHYRDIPQFGFEDISSDHFTQRVLQHCGSPEQVRSRVRKADPDAQQVIVERHEFPLPYMALREVAVDARQPKQNWLGGRPLISLMCGIANPGLQADIKGVLDAADQTVYLLTISLVSPVGK